MTSFYRLSAALINTWRQNYAETRNLMMERKLISLHLVRSYTPWDSPITVFGRALTLTIDRLLPIQRGPVRTVGWMLPLIYLIWSLECFIPTQKNATIWIKLIAIPGYKGKQLTLSLSRTTIARSPIKSTVMKRLEKMIWRNTWLENQSVAGTTLKTRRTVLKVCVMSGLTCHLSIFTTTQRSTTLSPALKALKKAYTFSRRSGSTSLPSATMARRESLPKWAKRSGRCNSQLTSTVT